MAKQDHGKNKAQFHTAGRFEHFKQEINKVLWPDSELYSIHIDYDNVTVSVEDSLGELRKIVCQGYIGYEALGHWDESVIGGARIFHQHELIDKCTNKIKSSKDNKGNLALNTGNKYRNQGEWYLFQITLIDGHEISIITADIVVE
jgi:hypothetical protein